MSQTVENLWVYDRWGTQIGCIFEWIDAFHTDEVNGEDSVTLVVPSILTQSGKELIKGDRIVWVDEFSVWHEHIINQVESFHLEGKLYYQIYAENSFVELMLDYKDERDSYNFKNSVALQRLLEGTRWAVGQVDDLGIGDIKYYHQSAYEGLSELLEIWGGEISTTITVGPGGVSARYINHRSQIGADNGLLFTYGYDMDGITRVVDLDEVYTRIYCYGKGEEVYNEETGSVGNGRRIDFAEVNGGKKYVEDNQAMLQWGHPDAYGGIQHSVGVFIWEDCTSPAELLSLGLAKLENVKQPRIVYEATVVALADAGFDFKNARKGDTVYLHDEKLEWRLTGRVLKVIRYFSHNKATEIDLGNTVRNAADVLRDQLQSVSDLRARSSSWDGAANANFQWLENLMSSLNAQFNAGGSYKFESFELGTIYSNVPLDADGRPLKTPASALQLTGLGFRIANSLTSTGDWNWRTFGTGDGFTADVINTGILQCGKNKIDLVTGLVSFMDGIIQDQNGKNYWNLATGEFRLSSDTQYLNGTLEDYFNSIKGEIEDVDEALGDLDTELRQAIEDGTITEAEAAAVAKLLQRVQTEQREAITAYTSVYGNSLLTGSPKTTLYNAKVSLYGTDGASGAFGTLVTRIQQVIACTTAAQIQTAMGNYNTAYTSYQSLRDSFSAALMAAQEAISNKFAEVAASAAVDGQTQKQIFDKLTNNGASQGIYMATDPADSITKLYLNATYMKLGILTDNVGYNYWNLSTGEFRLSPRTTIDGSTIQELIGEGIDDFANSVYDPAIADLQKQIDGQIETWYYDYVPTLSNVPASSWKTDTERARHEGDLFFNKLTGYAYRFFKDGSTWKWQLVQDTDITKALSAASTAQDTADAKRRVFVAQPTPPYDIGDLWSQGTDGDLMRCQTARKSGSFVQSDWIKASKYTDDTALDTFLKGDYATTIKDLQAQDDKKAETWYQSNDPSAAWTTSAAKNEHKGDLWFNSSNGEVKRWNGTSWAEMDITPPDSVFDKIDGKAQIFISQPKPPYHKGDLWFNSASSDIMTCITERLSGNYTESDWQKRNKYIDSSTADTAAKKAVDAQTQQDIFNKLTNDGKIQGITMKDGNLYINASYINSGTMSANRVRAGLITDKDSQNTWNLDTGKLTAGNIEAVGTFTCGDRNNGYAVVMNSSGQLAGYNLGSRVGFIDFSQAMRRTDTGVMLYGIKMQANGCIGIYSPNIAVAASSSTSTTATLGLSTSQTYCRYISNLGNGAISWDIQNCGFSNGFCTDF